MVGDKLVGACQCCGKEAELTRMYFKYPIKCECHSPTHFEFVDHCSNCVPREPEYTKILVRTDDLKKTELEWAMVILKNALSEDRDPGSYYHSWQSNIACDIMDGVSNISHEKANKIAKNFLDKLLNKRKE